VHESDPNYPFVHNATEAPLVLRNYDYIIVGGGTAGCPLAATLSQNFTVLLLERGGMLTLYTSDGLVRRIIGFEM
jgi:2-polyprenyl-6-methoxyphenol hydroxylase-like FAD-dependent oxidoreductase